MGEIIMNKKDQKIYQLSMEVIYGRLNISEKDYNEEAPHSGLGMMGPVEYKRVIN
jgi:hypothetical protein